MGGCFATFPEFCRNGFRIIIPPCTISSENSFGSSAPNLKSLWIGVSLAFFIFLRCSSWLSRGGSSWMSYWPRCPVQIGLIVLGRFIGSAAAAFPGFSLPFCGLGDGSAWLSNSAPATPGPSYCLSWLNHGCCKASDAVIRCSGSSIKSSSTRLRAEADLYFHWVSLNSNWHALFLESFSSVLLPRIRLAPVRIL